MNEATGLSDTVKKFYTLAFLKPDRSEAQIEDNEECDLVSVFNEISQQFMNLEGQFPNFTNYQLTGFITYFTNTWMSNRYRWNIFALDDHRTNNDLEGWHNHMNRNMKRKNNLWSFIESIKIEQAAKEVEVNQILNGQVIAHQRREQRVKEEILKNQKAMYIANIVSPLQYNTNLALRM